MAITATWTGYLSTPPYNKNFDNLPYLPLNITENLQVLGLKFHGSEIEYVEIFLQDEFADIYKYDPYTIDYRANLITNADIEVSVARFWTFNVKMNSAYDLSVDYGAVTYDNGALNDGAGATLTSGVDGKFIHDSNDTFTVGDYILIKDQLTQTQNGIYVVTILGNDTAPWVLTRVPTADTGAKIKDVIVTNETVPSIARQLDQVFPITIGTTNLTFSTTIASEADLDSNLTWTNILAKDGSSMVRYVLNKALPLVPTEEDNIALTLNNRFESLSYKLALKLTRINNGFEKFQIRNLKLMSQFKSQLPETSARPVKIYTEIGLPIIRETMQVEYYSPTTTIDYVNYDVTDKNWLSSDTVEVYRQPSGGVRSVVSKTEYLVSNALGKIIFNTAQSPTATITVTISRPLTEQGIQ